MNKLYPKLATLFLLSITLSGCNLYFEDDGYFYCDEYGCYECDDYGCYPTVDGSGPNQPGATCTVDSQCNSGAFCNNEGVCAKTDFCMRDGECGNGFDCDEARNSCVPQAVACELDSECDTGYCDAGICQTTASCSNDNQCSSDEVCDGRGVCIPSDHILCQAEVADNSCGVAEPDCEVGTTAAITNGCFTGECVANSACGDDNPCGSNTRAECDADSAAGQCQAVFRGINCKSPDGQACDNPNAPNCSCERFVYHSCEDRNN